MTREKMEVHLDRCMAIAASIETLVNGGRFPHKSGVHRRHGTA